MASKNTRAAEARAKAQAQVKNKERRTTVMIIAASLAVIAIFGGIVYFIVQQSAVPPLSEAHRPAGSDLTGGIPVGASGVAGEEGLTEGATRVDLYLDLLCPVCNSFEQVNAADLDELREAGKINVYYHPISILDRYSAGTQYPTRAANAIAVVADQSPEHVVPFIEALFQNQPAENTPGLDDASIAAIAIGVGVPTEVANTFEEGEFTKWVRAATDQASIDGMTGTPTVMIEREILDPNATGLNYFAEGVLKQHLEGLAAK